MQLFRLKRCKRKISCMNLRSGPFRILGRGLLAVGALLLLVFVLAHVHRFMSLQSAMASFEARQEELGVIKSGNAGIDFKDAAHQNPEHSSQTIRRAEVPISRPRQSAEPLALLRIPALQLVVPVLEGTDEFTLNRGLGRIAGTAMPGERGNIGIAGHRDSFFRRLEHISVGETIELVTLRGTDVYEVDQIRVTTPTDLGVLQPRTSSSLTLVTCYPFHFLGPAPSRYIVEASLKP